MATATTKKTTTATTATSTIEKPETDSRIAEQANEIAELIFWRLNNSFRIIGVL